MKAGFMLKRLARLSCCVLYEVSIRSMNTRLLAGRISMVAVRINRSAKQIQLVNSHYNRTNQRIIQDEHNLVVKADWIMISSDLYNGDLIIAFVSNLFCHPLCHAAAISTTLSINHYLNFYRINLTFTSCFHTAACKIKILQSTI